MARSFAAPSPKVWPGCDPCTEREADPASREPCRSKSHAVMITSLFWVVTALSPATVSAPFPVVTVSACSTSGLLRVLPSRSEVRSSAI